MTIYFCFEQTCMLYTILILIYLWWLMLLIVNFFLVLTGIIWLSISWNLHLHWKLKKTVLCISFHAPPIKDKILFNTTLLQFKPKIYFGPTEISYMIFCYACYQSVKCSTFSSLKCINGNIIGIWHNTARNYIWSTHLNNNNI